ncbi:MAG: hypothetical protein B6A08_14675 [Sorangiineae bacterium NIC37A_2]|nr:MAG: hypothetical protein B6A08_14675 [Sorangiineae bacterium NIC37A_2]
MRRSRSLAICFAGLGALAACQTTGRARPEGPAWAHHPSFSLQLAYSRDLSAASKAQGEPHEKGQPEIDAIGRRVFVGSSDGALYAIDAPSGEVLWRFETLGPVQSQPLYDPRDNAVYFGSHDGALYKVNADTGRLHYRVFTRAEVARRPVVHGDLVYFTNANDTLIAVHRRTGKMAWSHHRSPAMGMEVAGYSGPCLFRGLIYQGFSDGTATAFDAKTGEERWRRVDLSADAEDVLGEVPQYLDVDTTPLGLELGVGPTVIFGHYLGGVSALDAELGTLLWSNPDVVGVSDIVYFEEPMRYQDDVEVPGRRLIIASTGTTGLWALDPETGAPVWRQNLPRGGVSAVTKVSGLLLVGASQLGVYALSPVDGSVVDGMHFDLGVSATPVGFGRRAFVMTNGGNFLAFTVGAPSDPDRFSPLYNGSTTN